MLMAVFFLVCSALPANHFANVSYSVEEDGALISWEYWGPEKNIFVEYKNSKNISIIIVIIVSSQHGWHETPTSYEYKFWLVVLMHRFCQMYSDVTNKGDESLWLNLIIIKLCYSLELLESPMTATLELKLTSRHHQKWHKRPCFASWSSLKCSEQQTGCCGMALCHPLFNAVS